MGTHLDVRLTREPVALMIFRKLLFVLMVEDVVGTGTDKKRLWLRTWAV